MEIVVNNATGNAGDVHHLDCVFAIPAVGQVLADFVNPAFTPNSIAGTDFLDISPWVDFSGSGIAIRRGRGDSVTEMTAATVTIPALNDAGLFTQNPATANLITVLGGSVQQGCRIQVNASDPHNDTWYTRFDGPLTTVDYDNSDNSGNTASITISASDVLSYLTRQPNQLTWTQATVLADSPAYHWPLDDAGASNGATGGVARELSGNGHNALHAASDDSSGAIAWADTSGGIETQADAAGPGGSDGSSGWGEGSYLPNNPVRGPNAGSVGPFSPPLGAVLLTPHTVAGSAQNQFVNNEGYYLTGTLDQPLAATGNWDAELWFTAASDVRAKSIANANVGPWVQLSLGSSRTQNTIVAGIFPNGLAGASYTAGYYANPPAYATKNFTTAPAAPGTSISVVSMPLDNTLVPHHLVLQNVNGVVYLWLDGVSIGTFTIPGYGFYDQIAIGAAIGGGGGHNGHVSLCQIYNYNLSAAQILAHCQNGLYGNFEQTTDTTIAQIATLAGVPPFWNSLEQGGNGLSLTDYYDISQQNPLTNMQIFEQMERGLLFTNAAGQLSFHTRDWRMGYGAPDLYLPPDTFDGAMGLKLTDQFMQNAVTVTSTAFTSGASYQNAASVLQYGPYFSNYTSAQQASAFTPSSVVLPLYAWNRAGAQLGLTGYQFRPDPNFSNYASWVSSAYGVPWQVPGTVTLDLLTLDPAKVSISQLYGLEIDNMVAPSGTLPTSFPGGSNEWFIEGIQENIAQESRTMQLMLTPAATQRAWRPSDATYGALGTTSRIGISSPSTDVVEAWGKDVAHDTGRPYWAPDFTALPGNIVQNGDFATGDLTGWSTSSGMTDSFTNAPPAGMPKHNAALITYGSSGSFFYASNMTVLAQQEYTMGAWVYSTAGCTIKFQANEKNSSFQFIDNLVSGVITVPAATPTYISAQITGTSALTCAWDWGVVLTTASTNCWITDLQCAPGNAGPQQPVGQRPLVHRRHGAARHRGLPGDQAVTPDALRGPGEQRDRPRAGCADRCHAVGHDVRGHRGRHGPPARLSAVVCRDAARLLRHRRGLHDRGGRRDRLPDPGHHRRSQAGGAGCRCRDRQPEHRDPVREPARRGGAHQRLGHGGGHLEPEYPAVPGARRRRGLVGAMERHGDRQQHLLARRVHLRRQQPVPGVARLLDPGRPVQHQLQAGPGWHGQPGRDPPLSHSGLRQHAHILLQGVLAGTGSGSTPTATCTRAAAPTARARCSRRSSSIRRQCER